MITIKRGYQDAKGRKIYAGSYEDTDPALFGLVDYLVGNGHATWLVTEPVDVEPVRGVVTSIPSEPVDMVDPDEPDTKVLPKTAAKVTRKGK